jgi:hypothetical protein
MAAHFFVCAINSYILNRVLPQDLRLGLHQSQLPRFESIDPKTIVDLQDLDRIIHKTAALRHEMKNLIGKTELHKRKTNIAGRPSRARELARVAWTREQRENPPLRM